jgi:L-aspartate oxidase
LTESSTDRAQGGIAISLQTADGQAHIDDTMRVACGLADRAAVELMVRESAACLRDLQEYGADFDCHEGELALAREGGHTASRVVHAMGDATGREIARALIERARATESLRLYDHCFVIDLITVENRCLGAVTYHPKYGHQLIWAKQIVLATGGCGCLYRETTNPNVATGDGHAMAYRAGAKLCDMEMVQFHPTTLYIAGASRALISEAVRGEGGKLVNRDGERFMTRYHPDAELAPRDVVSRAIIAEMSSARATNVYLDVRHLPGETFRQRFPHITKLCSDFSIDVTRDPIPIRPAAHYMIGGVKTDLAGRTNVENLFACGEAASVGVHGANRLASNSLLEGMVFGRIVGRAGADAVREDPAPLRPMRTQSVIAPSARTELDLADIRNSLRSIAWRNVGIERNGERLAETIDIINFWGHYAMDKVFDGRFAWEAQNMLTVMRLVATAAGLRTESRGVHYRTDFPELDDAAWRCRLVLFRAGGGLAHETFPCENS